VTGDGHQGISLSGVSHSGFGNWLQVPAAVMGRVEHPCSTAADQGWSALPKDSFGSQVSALRSLVRVRGKIQIPNLYLNLNT